MYPYCPETVPSTSDRSLRFRYVRILGPKKDGCSDSVRDRSFYKKGEFSYESEKRTYKEEHFG